MLINHPLLFVYTSTNWLNGGETLANSSDARRQCPSLDIIGIGMLIFGAISFCFVFLFWGVGLCAKQFSPTENTIYEHFKNLHYLHVKIYSCSVTVDEPRKQIIAHQCNSYWVLVLLFNLC